jgi:hypothetical protein
MKLLKNLAVPVTKNNIKRTERSEEMRGGPLSALERENNQ